MSWSEYLAIDFNLDPSSAFIKEDRQLRSIDILYAVESFFVSTIATEDIQLPFQPAAAMLPSESCAIIPMVSW